MGNSKSSDKKKNHKDLLSQIKSEIGKVIVGQEAIVEEIIISFFSRGHCLVRGLPGLAKTTLVRTISRVFGLKFSRIQFTPDLMPGDLIGYEVLEEIRGKKQMKFIPGPIFSQILLADEINRTPPKTQAALLQAMEEKEITVMGKSYPLEAPFLVLATQNPIEQEGTYPLPEAQLDRFLFLLNVDYPNFEEELSIVQTEIESKFEHVRTLFTQKEIIRYCQEAQNVQIAPEVLKWIVKLVHATRPGSEKASAMALKYVSYGASPRASKGIVTAAKVFAYLEGKKAVEKKHIERIAYPILRHRIVLNFSGEAELKSTDDLIREILKIKL